jgi:hypothetical protein
MARIRTIKPEFFTSEDIVELPPLARLLYIALWCEADKEGRMIWKPRTFKMRYLPADDCDIDALADALVTRGLIVLYGDGLAVIPSFKTHQHINPREKLSTLDAPTDDDFTRAPRVATRHWPDSDGACTRREEGKGREGKGKEGKGRESSMSEETSDDDEDDQPSPGRKQTDPEDEKCARWLYGRLLKTNPEAAKPNWSMWAKHIRLMRERDGRTHRQICELYDWAKSDDFWSGNIISPEKLRKQWDTLVEHRARPTRQQQARPPVMNDREVTLATAQRAKALIFGTEEGEGESHAAG